MSATFVYQDKKVSTGTSSSSGPNGSSESQSKFTEKHELINFTLSGYTEHYELVGSVWFMSSSDGVGANSLLRTYGTSSSGSGFSVAYSGDYSGGNGSRYITSDSGSADHSEVDKTHETWSSHTTAVPGGATTITSTASGGEEASGTDDSTGGSGWEKDVLMSGSGFAENSMSAFSSARTVHNEYKDSTHYNSTNVTVHSPSGSGGTTSGSGGTASGGQSGSGGTASGGTASGSGTASGGSGSFQVSGNDTVTTVQKWSSDSGSGHTVTWTGGSSYSNAVDYWGFGQDENVAFPSSSIFFGPGQNRWNDPGMPGELEPGPLHGAIPGDTAIGPSSGVADETPVTGAAEPDLLALGGMEASLGAFANMAQAQKKVPAAAQAPGAMKQVQNVVEGKADEFNGVKKQPDKFGGEGLPFSNSRGPVSIVGIAGGGVHPRHEEGGFKERELEEAAEFTDSGFSDLLAWISRNKLRPGDREVHVKGKTKVAGDSPQIYGSTDEFPITDNNGKEHTTQKSKEVEEIAQEQLGLITDTVGEDGSGLRKDEQAFRLLIVGHSWGADKAIKVVNRLGELLNDNPQLKALYDEDRIQIHLITLDAIEQGTAAPSTRKLDPGVHVDSWLNLSQVGDKGFGILQALQGSQDDDFEDEHSEVVDEEMLKRHIDKPGPVGTGWHAFLPKAARWHIERYF